MWRTPFSTPQVEKIQPIVREEKSGHPPLGPIKQPTQKQAQDEEMPQGRRSSLDKVASQKGSPQQQQLSPSDQTTGEVIDTVSMSNAQKSEAPEKADGYLLTDHGPVPLQFGVPYFDPPTWKVEFNPTLEEMKQLDKIAAEVNDSATPESRRTALIAEREALIQKAQRPRKYISGTIITPGDDPGPTNVDWYKEYHRLHPEESK